MKTIFKTALLALPLFFALAEPKMPIGFKASATQPENSTWREYGSLPQPYVMAVAAVKAGMEAQGYTLKHDIKADENAKQCVMLWEKTDEKIIVMMWQIDIKETGCAWGVSND